MQFISAGIVSGIPGKSSVVEVDALDGKNIFYLPKGTDFTAVMFPGKTKKVKIKNYIIIKIKLYEYQHIGVGYLLFES